MHRLGLQRQVPGLQAKADRLQSDYCSSCAEKLSCRRPTGLGQQAKGQDLQHTIEGQCELVCMVCRSPGRPTSSIGTDPRVLPSCQS